MSDRATLRRDVIALAALVVSGIGVPLWLAASAGAIGLPSNDDWVYMRASASLFATGSPDLQGHTAAFIGQLALVQPFLWLSQGDPWAFTAFGLLMTGIGIVAAYLLARRFVRIRSAVLVVLLVAAFPGFARSSASFMTDVPAYALIMVSLLLGARWLQGADGRATLIASIAIGLLAVSIRQFALAAPVAVLVASWARNRPRDRILLAALSVLALVVVRGILSLATSVSGGGGAAVPDSARYIFLGPLFTTLAAVLLPATLLRVGPRMASFSAAQVIIAAGVTSLVVLHPDGPLLGNLWTPYGVADNNVLVGLRDPVIGEIGWSLSRGIALFAGILAAAVVARWVQHRLAAIGVSIRVGSGDGIRTGTGTGTGVGRALVAIGFRIARARDGLLVLFLAAYGGELVLYSALGKEFDRYLYPLVPVAAILLLRGPRRPFVLGRRHAVVHGAFAWLVLSAFAIAANSFAYDAARYREGDAAVALGYRADTIDAGYEWSGMHLPGIERLVSESYGLRSYGDYIFASFPCAILSNSALDRDDFRLIRVNRTAYRQYLLFGPQETLYLYGVVADNCPPPPAEVSKAGP